MIDKRPSKSRFGPIVATAAVATAAYLRYARGYYFTQQGLLILLAIVLGMIAVVALLASAGARSRRRPRLVTAACCAAAFGAVLLMARESPAENRRKNGQYLERLAAIAGAYTVRHGEAPRGLDQAVDEEYRRTGTLLPNRGDADGHKLSYRRLDAHAFALNSSRSGVTVIYRDGQVRSVLDP